MRVSFLHICFDLVFECLRPRVFISSGLSAEAAAGGVRWCERAE